MISLLSGYSGNLVSVEETFKRVLKARLVKAHGSSTCLIFHMSLAYSWIVRSLLNLDEPAVFKIDILVHLCNH